MAGAAAVDDDGKEKLLVGCVERGFTCTRVSHELGYTRTYIDRGNSFRQGLDRHAHWDNLDGALASSQVADMGKDTETAELFTWVKDKAVRTRGDARSRSDIKRDSESRVTASTFLDWPRILTHHSRESESLQCAASDVVDPGILEPQPDILRTVKDGAGPYCPLTESAISRLQSWFSHFYMKEDGCEFCRRCDDKVCFRSVPGTFNNDFKGGILKRLVCQPSEALGFRTDMMSRVNAAISEANFNSNALWLNDEIINGYLELLETRSRSEAWRENGGATIAAFNSYLYYSVVGGENGRGYEYSKVQSWRKDLDVLDFDYILVPIHSPGHWSLCVVYVRRLVVQHIDSLHFGNREPAKLIARWFSDRLKAQPDKIVTETEVRVFHSSDVPLQTNSFDCGVFVCTNADFICRDLPLDFTSEHMPYFRARIAHQLLVRDAR